VSPTIEQTQNKLANWAPSINEGEVGVRSRLGRREVVHISEKGANVPINRRVTTEGSFRGIDTCAEILDASGRIRLSGNAGDRFQ